MFICLFPVAFWSYFKYHIENATKQIVMLNLWEWNTFAIIVQTLVITSEILKVLDIKKLR